MLYTLSTSTVLQDELAQNIALQLMVNWHKAEKSHLQFFSSCFQAVWVDHIAVR